MDGTAQNLAIPDWLGRDRWSWDSCSTVTVYICLVYLESEPEPLAVQTDIIWITDSKYKLSDLIAFDLCNNYMERKCASELEAFPTYVNLAY